MSTLSPTVKINPSWYKELDNEFQSPYFSKLKIFVKNAYRRKIIYPSAKNIFHAFDLCNFNDVKVVILGQDPYHGVGQAHGLAFSVPKDIMIPPSLSNIFKEIKQDIGVNAPKNGDLTRWSNQGVLLLNATLTVEAQQAGSHQNQGWEIFTNAVIQQLSKKKEGIVFMLWGSYARRKSLLIDKKKHIILQATHPSPLSAYRGFFGCRHFSKTNEWLKRQKKQSIDW